MAMHFFHPEMGEQRHPDSQIEASLCHYGNHYYIKTPLELKGRGIRKERTLTAAMLVPQAAAAAALESDPRASRLNVVSPKGQRILHSAWAGAKFDYSCGAMGVMNGSLTDAEKAAISAADDAGRAAARNEIEAADAAATAE